MFGFLRKRLITVLIALGVAVLGTILYLTVQTTRDLMSASERIDQTQQVIIESDQLSKKAADVEVNGRVYLVIEDESALANVEKSERDAVQHLRALRHLVKDRPAQLARVDSLTSLFRKHTNLSQILAAVPEGEDLSKAVIIETFKNSKAFQDTYTNRVTEFQSEEYKFLAVRREAAEASVRRFEWFLIGLVSVLGFLMILIMISVRQSEQLRARITLHNKNLEKSFKEVSDFKYALNESSIVAITDQRGIIKHVNDNFCKISKYKREELIGKDHRIINSGYHSKDFIRSIWETISQGKVWKGELRNMAKDGSIYWVDTSIVPFLNENGRPYQYLAIRSDITERKVAEEIKAANLRLRIEIQEKGAELAGVLERISDGLVVLDGEFRYTYVNRRMGEMVRKAPSEMVGKHVWDVFPGILESPSYNAIQDAFNEQRYIHHMDYYPPLELWYENHIYPSPKGLTIFIRDVSQQMKAEQKLLESERIYRTIASSIPGSVIIIMDKDYRYLLVEGDMLAKLGYSKAALLGKTALEALGQERFNLNVSNFERVFAGESFSMELQRSNFDLLTRYVPLRDELDNVYAAMIASFDITTIKEAERKAGELNTDLERKIAERTGQLQAANKELESFSYSVAHDLRSPLRGITGYTGMLREDYSAKLDDEGRRLISEVEYNATRMNKLIDDLLAFSRLGRKDVHKSIVDMNELIESILPELPVGNADVRTEKLEPAFVDFALMKHVMHNLLSNAIKYSSKNPKPMVRISSSKDKGQVIYSITDNGVGFDMEYADKLFGVFQRLHTIDEFEGTGVGLAIVQRIVLRHGGKVWATGKVDQGASFYFSLPEIPADQTNGTI